MVGMVAEFLVSVSNLLEAEGLALRRGIMHLAIGLVFVAVSLGFLFIGIGLLCWFVYAGMLAATGGDSLGDHVLAAFLSGLFALVAAGGLLLGGRHMAR